MLAMCRTILDVRCARRSLPVRVQESARENHATQIRLSPSAPLGGIELRVEQIALNQLPNLEERTLEPGLHRLQNPYLPGRGLGLRLPGQQSFHYEVLEL